MDSGSIQTFCCVFLTYFYYNLAFFCVITKSTTFPTQKVDYIPYTKSTTIPYTKSTTIPYTKSTTFPTKTSTTLPTQIRLHFLHKKSITFPTQNRLQYLHKTFCCVFLTYFDVLFSIFIAYLTRIDNRYFSVVLTCGSDIRPTMSSITASWP